MTTLRSVILLIAMTLLAGCTSLVGAVEDAPGAPARCGRPEGVVLVIGAHRDVPAPSLDQRVTCRVTAAISAGKRVLLVVAAGHPSLIDLHLPSVHGGTLAQQNSPRVREDLQRVRTAVARARPGSPGVDDLAALAVAADAARSAGMPHADIMLIDSGLDDRGVLDFRVRGMVAAYPSEVVSQLRGSHNLPDLHGFTLFLVGLGYTAPPQPTLPARWRSNVTRIWTSVVKAAGATVEVIPQPAQGASVTTGQPVSLVPVPQDKPVRPAAGKRIVFSNMSPVAFRPNSTSFADRAAAAQALAPIARWLAAGRSRHARLVGTTADVGPIAGQIKLSRARANRVRDELIALGASRAQISTTGVGSRFPQFIPDRGPHGTLLAGPAARNRSVRITLRHLHA